VKREGDKRAPAGVFRLLEVYGFASREEADIVSFPYRHLTAGVEGIDDPSSRYYNRLVDGASVHRDWKSSEQMRRSGEVYRWGVVVGHNWNQIPGAGSCIFLHIWERPGEPTSGCTAMPADELAQGDPLARSDEATASRAAAGAGVSAGSGAVGPAIRSAAAVADVRYAFDKLTGDRPKPNAW
jgi:L,D-peptidoglycan transpeptidase YkuD (ErfK/YbiS/YcfS/YnhG family)